MNPAAYTRAMHLPDPDSGGQELILGEIIAAIHPYTYVWVPFFSSGTLVRRLRKMHNTVWSNPHRDDYGRHLLPPAEVIYFGTPTIVDNKALFPAVELWDKEKERRVVRRILERAAFHGVKRIVCGLGSGDISVEERIEDLGGGRVVAEKHFDEFVDWVIVHDLPAVTREGTVNQEPAVLIEGTESDERAVLAEGTVTDERVVATESAVQNERADSSEGTDAHERAVKVESA